MTRLNYNRECGHVKSMCALDTHRGEPKMAHTPTPWKVSESLRNDGAYALLGDNALANGGHHWKRIDNLQGGFTHGDAAFIVRAVNAQDDLKTACVWALHELERPHPNPKNKLETIAFLKDAIAKAEGRS